MRRFTTVLAGAVLLIAGSLAVKYSVGHASGGLPCDGRPHTLDGTPGDDVLVGTNGDDVIFGNGGKDVVKGKGGKDCIVSGDGHDNIYCGPGDDRNTYLGCKKNVSWW